MKIIAWNCNMAFRKKAEFILEQEPDILIIPECEHPDKLKFPSHIKLPLDVFWYGENQNKGLGVFSFGDLKIEILEHNPAFKFILPFKTYSEKVKLTVFAIWTQKPNLHDCYTEQVWNAVNFYGDILYDENVILAGDFNSNSIWDKPKRIYNHTNLVELLRTKNILSAYHHFHSQTQGKEKDGTLFMHRKADRQYHIDYCFASQNLIDKIGSVEIGTYGAWTKYSDHMPLIIDFKF